MKENSIVSEVLSGDGVLTSVIGPCSRLRLCLPLGPRRPTGVSLCKTMSTATSFKRRLTSYRRTTSTASEHPDVRHQRSRRGAGRGERLRRRRRTAAPVVRRAFRKPLTGARETGARGSRVARRLRRCDCPGYSLIVREAHVRSRWRFQTSPCQPPRILKKGPQCVFGYQ